MSKSKKIIMEYCCGCGLCESLMNKTLFLQNGFYYPKEISEEDATILKKICPFSNSALFDNETELWGTTLGVNIGYSTTQSIRKKGSSGGVISALLSYMLKNGYVDSVLHIGQDDESPWRTKVYCSSTVEEVLSHAGSRYAQSAPLSMICEYLKTDKKYAFVGKPCDIRSIRNFASINDDVNKRIIFYLSFFCMGVPSDTANIKLIKEIGVNLDECTNITYRGNGWPGETVVSDSNGYIGKMSYNDSWGHILGRDLKKCCRFCMDGVGAFADITCADAWYLDEDGKPNFDERDGRDLIFTRTEKGATMLRDSIKNGYVTLTDKNVSMETVKKMQPSQYKRKVSMNARIAAMKTLAKPVPAINKQYVKLCSREQSNRENWEAYKGMIKRILQNKV